MRVRDARFGNLLGDREEGVEAFGDGPRETLLFGFVLHVARGHVNCEEVACTLPINTHHSSSIVVIRERTPDSIQRALIVRRVQIPHRLAHDQPQLDFIVQVRAARPQHGALAGEQNRRRGFEEEEGLFGLGVVEFGDVVAVES